MNHNRMHNVTNPHQGRARKVLCVCSAGLLRSPTAAVVLAQAYGYNTRAVGAVPEYALIPIDPVLIQWADEVVFMSQEHKDAVGELHKPFQVLNIPDEFGYMDPRLVLLIKERYEILEPISEGV